MVDVSGSLTTTCSLATVQPFAQQQGQQVLAVYRHPNLPGQLVAAYDPAQAVRLVNAVQPGVYLDERLFVDTNLKSRSQRMYSTASSLFLSVQGVTAVNFNEIWEKTLG